MLKLITRERQASLSIFFELNLVIKKDYTAFRLKYILIYE